MRIQHCRARLNVRSLLPTPAYAPTQWLTSLLLEQIKNLCQHGYRPLLPCHLRQRRLRLGEPECHVHGTVEVDGGGQGDTGLLTAADLAVQAAQPKVAVGHERAHAERLGQRQGLPVVGFSLHDIGGSAWAWTTPSWCSAYASLARSWCCQAT